jgi:excisionase family DNA binding protein
VSRTLLTTRELAAQLGVSARWVYAQVEEHELPAYRLGRGLRFDQAAVDLWLYQRRTGAWESCASASRMVQ